VLGIEILKQFNLKTIVLLSGVATYTMYRDILMGIIFWGYRDRSPF